MDYRWLKTEGPLILVECKNWSSKCGKNEFVAFKEKIANRKGRCRLGFLISWNGFADTFTQEMLRGSREEILVVPLDGRALRDSICGLAFSQVLKAAWDQAVAM